MIESAMVSTYKGCTNNNPVTLNPYVYTKNHSERKPIRQVTETLYVKHNTGVCMIGTYKGNCKAMCCGQTFQSAMFIKKINQNLKESPYHCIILHPQVVLSPIANDCIYVSIDGNTKKH